MGLSEEEQMRAMLDAMGMDSMQDLPQIEPEGESERVSDGAIAEASELATTAELKVQSNEQSLQEADANPASEAKSQLPATESFELELPAEQAMELPAEPKITPTGRSETAASSVAASRDLSVQTLVHLLGLPTSTQFQVLETKLDVLTQKLQTIQLKIERVQGQLDSADTAATVDRIDYQISDIRTILKKLFPSLGVGFEGDGSSAPKKPTRAPQVLTSGGKPSGSAPEQAGSARTETSDEEFQQQEARRLRQDSTRAK